ncbi:nuclear body SP140 isoform X1 [Pelobates cultripes]|uniref:Nuclear body SP140 isoform X1 n=1 Tax=Pelobates cultripes TaxID=61616 RepID=A0AAD1SEY9_PELCU|nr:nuclear body SP140 isoform X1 [Pelobates cultripes]
MLYIVGQPDETDQSIKTSLQHFFARHKVPMCIAITHTNMFFEKLKENDILSEDDLLELKTICNVKRVVYKSLCLIEKKTQPKRFFDVLLQKPFLVKFPDLAPISRKYKAQQYECVYTTSSRSASLRRFFQEKKVAISFAIKKLFPFLNGLQDLAILSERESLKLQTDERSVHQVIYESLCWIEKKNVQIEIILDYIFLDCFLKIFPELMSISHEYGSEDVECVAPISANNDILKRIFKQQKVAICFAITKRFPFLHGLQDVGFLSELELLKLQADERSTQRVVYESLCWIEEKEKGSFKVFFVYIFQKCFLNFYCKLNIISQQIKTQADPVNICPISTEELKLILKREKTHISDAINLSFPFMNGLQDRGILSELELLNIQAEERTVRKVVHKTLCLIEAERTHLLQDFFGYLSQDMYLKMFPKLKEIVERILQNEIPTQRLGNRISKKPDINDSEHFEKVKTDSASNIDEPPVLQFEKRIGKKPYIYESEDFRNVKARLTSNFDEPPPLLLGNGISKKTDIYKSKDFRNAKAHTVSSLGETPAHSLGKRRIKKPDMYQSEDFRIAYSTSDLDEPIAWRLGKRNRKKSDMYEAEDFRNGSNERKESQVENPSDIDAISERIPRQAYNEQFSVKCGTTMGTFFKNKWNGGSSTDECIESNGTFYTLNGFQSHGGRESWKYWKRSITCEDVKLEVLAQNGILQPCSRTKNRSIRSNPDKNVEDMKTCERGKGSCS